MLRQAEGIVNPSMSSIHRSASPYILIMKIDRSGYSSDLRAARTAAENFLHVVSH